MKNKVLKVAIVIMLVIALTVADFIFLGTNLITYALENINDSTNNENVKFAAYFKKEEEKVSQVEYQIDNNQMKLYLNISVENEGYFDGTVTLSNTNFKLKEEILSDNISKIEGNTITLKRISPGNKDASEIEVGIEPIIEESYEEDMLSKESVLKLTGNYKDSTEKEINIEAEKKVALTLLPPNNIDTTLEANVITNRIYESEDARLVQIELNSSVVDNTYPVKSTTFEVTIPDGAEVLEVISKGTYATNGAKDQKLEYNPPENNLLKITIANESTDGNISWKKDANDIIVITLKLDKSTEIGTDEYNVKSKVEFYGKESSLKEKETKYNLAKESDGIIKGTVSNEEKYMYKGKIYSKEEREYQTTTNIEVNYANLAEDIKLSQNTVYKTENGEEKEANIEYKTTTISKTEIEEILGTEGKLTIKDQNENEIATVTSETQVGEDGQILITYPEGVKGLNIEITSPINAGIIRLAHTKVIKAENYTRTELQRINSLTERIITKYNSSETNLTEYTFERNMSLNETITTAKLTVVPRTLSTATTNEQVKIAVTLKTDNEMYDLYKNPTVKIKLPDSVKSINIDTLKINKLYLDEFEVTSARYLPNNHEIEIILSGEQSSYTMDNTNGYIEIIADIDLEEFTPNTEDKIILTYTNENAVSYENEGNTEVKVKISGHSGLVAYSNITNYNVKSNSAESKTAQVANLKMNLPETEANFQIALINNTGNTLENVIILGNLPVQGNIKIDENTFENTINATLKSGINLPTDIGTVYYTENSNADTDLSNTENGWTTNVSQLQNPVLYLIQIAKMEKATNIVTGYTMTIPANLEYDKEMKTAYVVEYMSNSVAGTVKTVPVGLETGKVSVTLEATVGGEILQNGDTIKAGEVIRYKINVTNDGSADATNVKLTAAIPEQTIYVEPMEDFEYADPIKLYYNEDETKTIFETIIETLKSGETKTIEYEVRVKSEVTSVAATNKATVVYNNDIEVSSNEITNQLEKGDIRVTVKRRTDVGTILFNNQPVQYFVIVENISNDTVENIELNINLPQELSLKMIEDINDEISTETESNNLEISSINSGEAKIYKVYAVTNEMEQATKNIKITAVATHNQTQYRSNEYNDNIYGYDVNISMTATHEGEYLKAGDTIEYKITVTNNSKITSYGFSVQDVIPKQLSITKVQIDGKELDEINNNLDIAVEVEPENSQEIIIQAIVNYDSTRLEIEKISNSATLLYFGQEVATVGPIVHYLESIIVKPPVEPDYPDEPDNPDNPDTPDTPDNPDNPDNPEEPDVKKYSISGRTWIDQDKDGELNNKDTILSEVTVKLLNVETNEFVRNEENNKDLTTVPDEDGYYSFENIPEGKYIVVFEYDNTLYKPTIYKKENVDESKKSDVVSKILTINGEESEYATTDEITLNTNIANINIGVVFIKRFDIKLDKYISKLIVQTSNGTTTYDYENENFARVEINAKRMAGSTVIVQYTIKLTNIGDVDAYVNSLVDYAPEGLKFSSELNKDWYEAGANLHTNALSNEPIAPGESREINLVLTKNVNAEAELINNMAEIEDAYNIYGIEDTNSVQANKNKDENDLGSADLIIGVQTGTMFNYIALVISMLGIVGVAAYLIKKKILRIKL